MTMLNTQSSWHVGRAGGQCAACAAVLTPNLACWAALCERPIEARRAEGASAAGETKAKKSDEKKDEKKEAEAPSPFVRVDFCEACWAAGKRPEAPLTMFSHWRTVIAVPEQKKKLLVDDSVLIDMFQRLGGREDSSSGLAQEEIRFRFVLALILMRKRILKYEGTEAPQAVVLPTSAAVAAEGTPSSPPTAIGPAPHVWLMRLRGTEDQVRVIDPHLTPEQIGEVSGQLSAILAEEV